MADNIPIRHTQSPPLRACAPRDEIVRLSNAFEPYGDFFAAPWLFHDQPLLGGATLPAVDLIENATAYEMSVELPGMTENDVQIEVLSGDLRIKGEKTDMREKTTERRYLCERRYGAFERRFTLPRGIDANNIAAVCQHGVLTITVPKTGGPPKAPRRIPIHSR